MREKIKKQKKITDLENMKEYYKTDTKGLTETEKNRIEMRCIDKH